MPNLSLADDLRKYMRKFSADGEIIQPRASLFMVGERGAGKSTLMAVLQLEREGISCLLNMLVEKLIVVNL